MAVLKKIENGELYVYMNGNLIYKRWLESGESKVFDIMAYDKYTHSSFHELGYENLKGIILVKARLKLKATEDGGRTKGVVSGYRPNHVFEYNDFGFPLQTYIGDIQFENNSILEPGKEQEVTVRFLMNQPIEEYLTKGRIWWIHEGIKQIGKAEIISFL